MAWEENERKTKKSRGLKSKAYGRAADLDEPDENEVLGMLLATLARAPVSQPGWNSPYHPTPSSRRLSITLRATTSTPLDRDVRVTV